jgi:hypothetical protein
MANDVDITGSIPKATEIAFCFDTTGSMNPCIANVRKHIEKTCEDLFKDIPNLKVGFIAHGDYCDGPKCYTILELTDDQSKVFSFIRNAPATGGGDEPECYELALNLAKGLKWSDSKGGKVLVMIGDAAPHEPDYPENKDKLDWRKELADLKEMGIAVYPLQCLYYDRKSPANQFWAAIGEVMGTPLLKLHNFEDASLAVKGFAYAATGSEAYAGYEKKLARAKVKLSPEISSFNTVLRDEAVKYDTISEVKADDDK